MMVINESDSRRDPTEAASTIKVNLEAKSSLERVSTCQLPHIICVQISSKLIHSKMPVLVNIRAADSSIKTDGQVIR